jgi:heme/copper-type cytochrome/quinol oxidase subunit 4
MFKNFFEGMKYNFIDFFAFIVFGACLYYLFFISEKTTLSTNVAEIKTAVIAIMMIIANYYWGSSKASSKKDDSINTMAKTIDKTQ